MQANSPRVIKTGSSVDLAFAVVVLASYFATFSSLRTATTGQISLMVVFGVAYIGIGIYGYKFCAESRNAVLRLLYFAVQIPIGGAIVYLSRGAGFNGLILLPLAGHSVVLLLPVWLYGINSLLVLTYILSLMAFSASPELIWSSLPTFLAGVIFIMVFTQMAVGEERARLEVERLLKDLGEANNRLREYTRQVEELTITRERNRMAREIHDGLGHYLTTIHMQIQAAASVMRIDPEKARLALEKAQAQTQEALLDVRRSVAALHSRPEESLPLEVSIAKVVDGFSDSAMKATLSVDGEPRVVSPPAQLTLYRAAQEGINNACKHSGATEVAVCLDYSQPEEVTLTVQDNGTGSDGAGEGGFGLLGLQERAHLLNGRFRTQSVKGQGFRLEITVPG